VNFYVKIIAGFVAVLLVALAVLFLFRTTDEKAIEQLLETGLKAAEAGDAEGVIALISPNYRNGDETRDSIARKTVAQRLPGARKEGAAIQVSGEDAEANVKVIVGLGQLKREFALKLQLRKENGVWKVTSAEDRSY
jgi:hypothetical protein